MQDSIAFSGDLEHGGAPTYRAGIYNDSGEWGTPTKPITRGGTGCRDELGGIQKDYWEDI